MKGSAFLLFLCCSIPAVGQTQKTAIAFECECTDAVGSQYATKVRDLLTTSPRYSLTTIAEEKDKEGKTSVYHWQIKVVSLDPSQNSIGQNAVLAIVLLFGDSFYLTHSVQWCPLLKVSDCAASTISSMDGVVSATKQ
jgi:hypothetical protein